MAKIIVAIDGNIPSKFAHSFNVMKMAQGFSKHNHVELVTLLTLPAIKNRLKLGPLFKHYGITEKFKATFLPLLSKKTLTQSIGVRRFAYRAAKYIYKQKPDLVFCRSYLITIECTKLGLNTVMETHAAEYSTNEDLKEVFKYANYENFKGIVTISNVLKSIYVKNNFPAYKILVLEDGVDLDRFNISDDKITWRKALNLPLDKNILLYTGGLYKEKGIESILQTQKKLNRKDIITLIIGGDVEQVLEWEKNCTKNKIVGVSFLGFKPNADLPKYMKAADILMMPYETNLKYKVMDINSTSPLKLFEYMGSKRPILSSQIPVISKVVKHNESAMLAKENDIQSQVDLVEELLANPEKADNISANAYSLAKRYEWISRCDKILKFYL